MFENIEAFDFLHAHDLVFKHDSTNPGRHELLVTRSEVDYIGDNPLPEPALGMWPNQGNGSQRWGMMAGYRKGQGANTTA